MIGSASMSARRPSVASPLPERSTPTTPVPPTLRCTSMPHSSSFCATSSAVRCSSRPSSGLAWMSRRMAVSSGWNWRMRSIGESVMSASFVWRGLAFLGEGAGGFAEVLGEMQLGEVHLQQHLAREALEMPAPRAYRRAHAERGILRHLRGELACCFHVLAGGRDTLDHAGGVRLLGGEE